MDVKPANILIINHSFKLCDLNIAIEGEGHIDLDGDPLYIAPEILRNKCFYSSDIFSLGMIYLQISNPHRRLPASGRDYEMLRKNKFAGWKIDGICRRMLEANPKKRISARGVLQYFEQWL